MVGHDSISKNLSHFQVACAGATSSFVTRALCQPFDVLKIRFQLQVEPITKSPNSKYQSIPQAFKLIVKEEGVTALWKGHVPAQLLSVVYGIGQFWSFELLSKEAHKLGLYEGRYRPAVNFACGALAGGTATVLSFPFDVARTRLVGQSDRARVYTGMFQTLTKIWQTEGFLTLFKGLWPTLLQVAPHTGVQFMTYKLFDSMCKSLMKKEDSIVVSSIISGSMAGLCAKTSIYPFDLLKKRMQIQGIQQYRKEFGKTLTCNGMIDCFRQTLRTEGISGLFKGLSASLLKAGITSAMHFTTYEVACKFLDDFNRIH